jgi:hypothetical protein
MLLVHYSRSKFTDTFQPSDDSLRTISDRFHPGIYWRTNGKYCDAQR